MTGIMVRALPMTLSSSSSAIANFPATNALNDYESMVWRDSSATPQVVLDMGTAASYDAIAIVGTNLTAGTSVTITLASDASVTVIALNTTVTSVLGDVVAGEPTAFVHHLGATYTSRYVRLRFNNVATLPSATLSVARAIVGPALTFEVDGEAEHRYEDRSIINEGRGFETVDEFGVYPSFKCSVSLLSETEVRQKWHPFMSKVGTSRPVFFAIDTATKHQTEMLYGRLIATVPIKQTFYDAWQAEITVRASIR